MEESIIKKRKRVLNMYVKEHYGCKFVELFGATAITLGRHIFYSNKKEMISKNLRIHEMKHVEQYAEYGVARFLFTYAKCYITGRISGLSHWEAYYEIPFEIEAHSTWRHENEL